MQNDEQEVRQLVSTWMTETKAGNVEKVLSLMAENAVFLVAGQPPMYKGDFAAAARSQAEGEAPKFDGSSEIQGIRILGDWAFMWQKLNVVAAPPEGGPESTLEGHTLTILKEESGKWVLARDANLLAPAEG